MGIPDLRLLSKKNKTIQHLIAIFALSFLYVTFVRLKKLHGIFGLPGILSWMDYKFHHMPFLHNIIISLIEFKAKLTLNSCDKYNVISAAAAAAAAFTLLIRL